MDRIEALTTTFESQRTRLRSVAYHMLGSLTEADDAVQETWLRLRRVDVAQIDNLVGWLTTVVARISLDIARRREGPASVRLPDPVISSPDGLDPEQHTLLADSVGLAMLVVLDRLTPAERLAFVLHDMFAVPFAEIAALAGRSTDAVKQLASRGRHKVRAAPVPDIDLARQRTVADAFFAAARRGDFDRLLTLLDPHIVVRADVGGAGLRVLHGSRVVAGQAVSFARFAEATRPALVNGAAAYVAFRRGNPYSVLALTIAGGRIAAIEILADPARLQRLDLMRLVPARAT